jgi:hypothetical protein
MPIRGALRAIVVVGLALFDLAGSPPAVAAEGGQVTVASGASFLTTNGQRNQLKMNDTVHVGDIVETQDGAKLKLSMADGSVLSLGANSRLTITAYTADPAISRDVQLGLDAGLMRAVVARSGANARFEVDTPTAVATVRSTDWFIEATPQLTTIRVIEGSVAVVRRPPPNAAPNAVQLANANPLVLNANWQADIDTGRDPPKIKPWAQQEFDALVERTSIGLGWCQCIADRTDIKGSCLATVEDCRGACGSTIYSYIPDARYTCTAPGRTRAAGRP